MASAEIFRVIDILAAPVDARPDLPAGDDALVASAVASLTPSSGPVARTASVVPSTAIVAANTSLVARRPAPIVEVQHLPLPATPDGRLVMLHEPSSARARSYRLIRHRLLGRGDPRVLVVTSASPSEGKTTCASNLALAIAEDSPTRVLVLDANLLRPGLGGVFGFQTEGGFVRDMTRGVFLGPPYPVVGIDGARLHVAALPAAPIPGGRLDRNMFASALHDLRGVYDYVVIDAASVLESGDADVAAECADGVLVAVRAGVTSKTSLRRAMDQISPATVLGSVLLDA